MQSIIAQRTLNRHAGAGGGSESELIRRLMPQHPISLTSFVRASWKHDAPLWAGTDMTAVESMGLDGCTMLRSRVRISGSSVCLRDTSM